MPKCNNCKKMFEAYAMEPSLLQVINKQPLQVTKLNCPVCGAMQHMFPSVQMEQVGGFHQTGQHAAVV